MSASKKVPVYTVSKLFDDEELKNYERRFLEEKDFQKVIKDDADVYTEDGELLLRFRKKVLPEEHIEQAYEALKQFIKHKSTDRGVASGSDPSVPTGAKTPVMSNIIGYFDKWSVAQKHQFKVSGIRPPGRCRITRFTASEPEKWAQVIPLIQDIDTMYKKLCPKEHANQLAAADTTQFRIADTAFTTVTTNLNFRTAAHYDKGDWKEGFGNLVVIERGAPYKGAFTGFPQYGVAVDCRTGDFLAMDVHRLHGNTPMIASDDTSQRLSLVSYLRENIVKNCGNQKMYDPAALQRRITRKLIENKKIQQTRKSKK